MKELWHVFCIIEVMWMLSWGLCNNVSWSTRALADTNIFHVRLSGKMKDIVFWDSGHAAARVHATQVHSYQWIVCCHRKDLALFHQTRMPRKFFKVLLTIISFLSTSNGKFRSLWKSMASKSWIIHTTSEPGAKWLFFVQPL